MKVQKVSRIGIVVGDDAVRAVQRVDGRMVSAQVAVTKGDLKKSLRKLLSSSPFAGRNAVVGLEGEHVLVESLVIPPTASKSPAAVCAERVKGDPVFNEDHAVLGVISAGASQGGSGPTMVMLAAVNRERISEVMAACREISLEVHTVEAASLASWRAWGGQGLQVRLLRGDMNDILLAGVDSKLQFCRVVPHPIAENELRTTLSRVGSLMGVASGGATMTVCGDVGEEIERVAKDLGLTLTQPPEAFDDPMAAGLATDGNLLTEFTPPEERTLRQNRRVKKVRLAMAALGLAVTGGLAAMAFKELSGLKADKLTLEGEMVAQEGSQAELLKLRAELALSEGNDSELLAAIPGHRMSRLWEVLTTEAPADVLIDTADVDDRELELPSADGKSTRKVRELEVRIAGLAADAEMVRTYADRLLATLAFSDVRVDTSERVLLDGGLEGERFRISARAETR